MTTPHYTSPHHTNPRQTVTLHDIRLLLPALVLWMVDCSAGLGGIRVALGTALLLGLLTFLPALRQLQKVVLVTLVAGICTVIPHLLVVAAAAPPGVERHGPSAVSLRSAVSSRVPSSEVLCGVVSSRPVLSARGSSRFSMHTPHGYADISARGRQWEQLSLGSRACLIATPETYQGSSYTSHHLSRGQWRARYLRSARAPRGLWALSSTLNARWECALHAALPRSWHNTLLPIARGMTNGDISQLNSAEKVAYRQAGLSHLTAVSGANITFMLLMVRYAVRSPRRKAVASAVALVGFVAVVGLEPAVMRAALSGAVGLLALWEGGRRQALPGLGAAMVVLLLLHPQYALQPGFALSVVATAGIVVGMPYLQQRAQRYKLPRLLVDVTGVAIIAHIVTIPLTVLFFGTVSTLGVVANILVAPAVPVVTALGLGGLCLAGLHLPLAIIPIKAMIPSLRLIHLVGVTIGSWEGAVIKVSSGAAGANGMEVRSALLVVAVIAALALLLLPQTRRVEEAWCKRGTALALIVFLVLTCAVATGRRVSSLTHCRAQGPVHWWSATASPHRVNVLPESLSASAAVALPVRAFYLQPGELPPRPLQTPQGTPVIRIPHGTEVLVNARGDVCQRRMAR